MCRAFNTPISWPGALYSPRTRAFSSDSIESGLFFSNRATSAPPQATTSTWLLDTTSTCRSAIAQLALFIMPVPRSHERSLWTGTRCRRSSYVRAPGQCGTRSSKSRNRAWVCRRLGRSRVLQRRGNAPALTLIPNNVRSIHMSVAFEVHLGAATEKHASLQHRLP